ncbi:MAG: hypothetical protein HYV26_09210 [Candidatus Hydrogenedentes bacterium]|nr:hypothetical protein [Candidatus Hydrogenedentota bacterium]
MSEDTMTGAPRYQQRGIELMLDTLRRAQAPVDIVSFGSARPVAVAYNRAPDLLRERVRRVHLCAGAAPAGYLEWNVQLDVHAFVRLLRADLPLAVYPCATDKGAFDLGPHNTYWSLPNLAFVRDMAPPLQRYIEYAFLRSNRHDFLTVLDSPDPLGDMTPHYAGTHHLWETAVWTQVAGLRVAHVAAASPPLTGERGEDAASTKGWRILPKMGAPDGAPTVEEQLLPCRFEVRPDGQFRWEGLADSQHAVYSRANPTHYEQALREALPPWYRGFSGLLATG